MNDAGEPAAFNDHDSWRRGATMANTNSGVTIHMVAEGLEEPMDTIALLISSGWNP